MIVHVFRHFVERRTGQFIAVWVAGWPFGLE